MAHGPRKGHMLPRAETPSAVFGHALRKRSAWSASRGSGVFRSKHGVPVHPVSAVEHASASSGLPWGSDLPLQIAIRPTDLCHPTNLSTCTRARGSRPVSRPRGMSPVARWIEGHDVSRRRRPLPPDRTLRPRVFTGAASCDLASDTPVARSWGRAAVADDCASDRSSQDRHHPSSVKRRGEGTIRCAFLR